MTFACQPNPLHNQTRLVSDFQRRNHETFPTETNHEEIDFVDAISFLTVFKNVHASYVVAVFPATFALNTKTVNYQVVWQAFCSTFNDMKAKVATFFCALTLKSFAALARRDFNWYFQNSAQPLNQSFSVTPFTSSSHATLRIHKTKPARPYSPLRTRLTSSAARIRSAAMRFSLRATSSLASSSLVCQPSGHASPSPSGRW
jgi:hypothetical protein